MAWLWSNSVCESDMLFNVMDMTTFFTSRINFTLNSNYTSQHKTNKKKLNTKCVIIVSTFVSFCFKYECKVMWVIKVGDSQQMTYTHCWFTQICMNFR